MDGMKNRILFVALAMVAALRTDAARFDLEWNASYDTAVPYEVELDCAKLAKAGAKGSFAVFARSAAGERELAAKILPGRRDGVVALRFSVPPGTTALSCETGRPAVTVAESASEDNIFADALAPGATARWQMEKKTVRITPKGKGLLFRNMSTTGTYVSYTADVPPDAAGRPVRLELDVASRSGLTWGGFIYVRQYGADGKELPTPVVDPRWTSHMRPPDKLTRYREGGRLHPAARKVSVRLELRGVYTSFDNHGMPLKDRYAQMGVLEVSHLALRPAAELPFPRYDDACFADGVSGAPHDMALALGGAEGRGLFYATRGLATWTCMYAPRREEELFFPSGDGTAEAWFRPSKWPAKDKVTLMEASHHNLPKRSPKAMRGDIMSLCYTPKSRLLEFRLMDMQDRVFRAGAQVDFPTGVWTHVALQWTAGGAAELFVGGRRVASVSTEGFAPLDLEGSEWPADSHACECYIGGGFRNMRDLKEAVREGMPLFEGAADLWRISTGKRYKDGFTPARTFACDASTRALFTFDRSFDGVSGGGDAFISGSYRALRDRVCHTFDLGGKSVRYLPAEIRPECDPAKALQGDNYPVVPGAAEFRSARATESRSAVLEPGGTLDVDVAGTPYMDFIEIANVSDTPLVYPIALNEGDIDPRSFGDFADTMRMDGLSDRDRANRIFQYVLGASDYFMNHTAYFPPDNDTPGNIEYQALTMLNAYCGFECGPLNNMTANLFACAGGCPASQTGGYGHSFEQVFYDGKNHIYDLSARKFFPAMDNETTECLGEAEVQPGSFHRIGDNPDHFIRQGGTRATAAQTPAYREKVALTLRPGERFRAWFDNDGQVNDLQCHPVIAGNGRAIKEDYSARTHAKPQSDRWRIFRLNRFFPQYGSGYIVCEAAPDAANPAFTHVSKTDFVYRVSSCYPIVAARYRARLKDGTCAKVQLRTDGKTWRDISDAPLRYEVRARHAYSVRFLAAPEDVAAFCAATEVQLNARIFPGRLRTGANRLTLKAQKGGPTRLTVQWRRAVKEIAVKGGVHSGGIPGAEHQLVALDPDKGSLALDVTGASADAVAKTHGGLSAALRDGRLTLTAEKGFRGLTAVDVIDGDAVRQLTVLVCPGVRLVTADALALEGGAKLLPAGAGRVQPCVMLASATNAAVASFSAAPAGKWLMFTLDRFESHPADLHAAGLVAAIPGVAATHPCAWPVNDATSYYKANFGRRGGRAEFKWDFPFQPGTAYFPHAMRIFDAKEPFGSVRIAATGAFPAGVELAAVLLVPHVDEEMFCDLQKVLCGLNCQPWRVTPGAAEVR